MDLPGDIPTTELVIEARDLDTDARVRRSVRVVAPMEIAGQRGQLERIVAEVHPDAKLRSFANGAATFLGRQQLVIAHYVELPALHRASEANEGTAPRRVEQGSLFAA